MSKIIHAWSILDKLYFRCSRLEFVDEQRDNIFRVRLLTYRGPSLSFEDGTTIQSSDLLLKIHLHNYRLMKEMESIDHDIKRALYVYQRVKQSLPGLAHFFVNHPQCDDIKALLGITVLNRGVKPLGFQVSKISNPAYRTLKGWFQLPMMMLLQPHKRLTLLKKGPLAPNYLMMTKEQLVNRYFKVK
ncbi:YkoP family protein [Ammoniphilus oxalaticus]|nr:hypothetical protein [Ammoniphilus oxalaticus]